MKAAIVGARKGPRKTGTDKIGNMYVRSSGDHMSKMLPPKVTNGGDPKRPIKLRQTSQV